MSDKYARGSLVEAAGLGVAFVIAAIVTTAAGKLTGDITAVGLIAFPAGLLLWTLAVRPNWLPGSRLRTKFGVAGLVVIAVTAIALVADAIAV